VLELLLELGWESAERQKRRNLKALMLQSFFLVEISGIEPLTS
jgi:hypothetical protein